jgi:hypothetical protein
MEFVWYSTGGERYETTKLLGGIIVFPEATCEPGGKAQKRKPDFRLPKNHPGNKGSNVQFRNKQKF